MIRIFLLAFTFILAELPGQDYRLLSPLNGTSQSLSNTSVEEGADVEKSFFNFLEELLIQEQLTYKENILSDTILGHSFSRQFVVYLGNPKGQQLLLFLPMNGKGARRNSNLGLAIIKEFSKSTLLIGLQVIFSGAEDPEFPLESKGSSFFLNSLAEADRSALLYMDLRGDNNPLLQSLAMGISSPIWMVSGILSAFESRGVQIRLSGSRPRFFRFNLPGQATPLDPFFRRNIPAVIIQTLPSGSEAKKGVEVGISATLEKWSGGFPKTWDRHYLTFVIGGWTFFLDQFSYVLFILSVWVIILGLAFIFFRKTKFIFSSLFPSFWQVSVYYALIFVILYISTETLRVLVWASPLSDIWKHSPLFFLVWKILLTMILYLGFFLFFRRIPLSRWSIFYQTSTLVLYLLMTLLAMYLSFGFSFFFLWSFLFSLLYTLLPWRWVKAGLFIVIPFWTIKGIWDTFIVEPDPFLIEAALFSPLEGNMLISLFVLPLLLLFQAFHYQQHQRVQNNERHQLETGLIVSVALFTGLTTYIVSGQLFQNTGEKWELNEALNYFQNTASLEVKSDQPFSSNSLLWQGKWKTLPLHQKTVVWQESLPTQAVPFQAQTSLFLDRRIWEIRFNLEKNVHNLFLRLESPGSPMVIFESNFPYKSLPGGSGVDFLIGRNPPRNIELKITLLDTPNINLEGRIEYSPNPELSLITGIPELPLSSTLTVDFKNVLAGGN